MNWQQQPNDLGSNPPRFPTNDDSSGNEPYNRRSLQGQSAWETNEPERTSAYNVAHPQLNPNGYATDMRTSGHHMYGNLSTS
ncbi:uncharacterized protein L203_104792 [Cryptococcus depauperatus CBS 7841]|uniref:Uncharacterized protein n=1 Tax=Cryptococcus depauperatus CBS 7841 TaxID=1295531 RepID=A0AAJ8M3F4_9TREE